MIPIECFFLVVESFSFKQASFASSIFVHDFDMIFDGVFHIFLFNLCQYRLRDRSPVLSLHFSSGRPNQTVGWSYSLSNASYPLAKRQAYLGIHRGRCFDFLSRCILYNYFYLITTFNLFQFHSTHPVESKQSIIKVQFFLDMSVIIVFATMYFSGSLPDSINCSTVNGPKCTNLQNTSLSYPRILTWEVFFNRLRNSLTFFLSSIVDVFGYLHFSLIVVCYFALHDFHHSIYRGFTRIGLFGFNADVQWVAEVFGV